MYSGSGFTSSYVEESFESYFDMMNTEGTSEDAVTAEKVQQWLDSLDIKTGHAYALRYEYAAEAEKRYFYLVYVPEAGNQSSSIVGQTSSIFGTTLTLGLHRTGDSGYLYNVTASAKKTPNLKIMLDGKKIPCEITSVEYNPTRYFIEPQYDETKPDATE